MKKIISVAIAVLMLLAFSACGDKDGQTSSSPTDVSPGDIEILDPTPTPEPQPVSELSICGIPIVKGGQPTGIGYKGAEYEDGVLTLEDLDILADFGSVNAIYFIGDLEIVVKGEVTITAENGLDAVKGEAAEDGSLSNLIIRGDGSLAVNAPGAFGISCSGTINVTCGALEVTGAEAAVEGGTESLTLGEGLVLAGDSLHIAIGPEA
ncbi:MAG: hypothetical protein EOM54_07585 [Clostridia bacterium]|nr:hypothetical protein [Clostridia bacterium]